MLPGCWCPATAMSLMAAHVDRVADMWAETTPGRANLRWPEKRLETVTESCSLGEVAEQDDDPNVDPPGGEVGAAVTRRS